MPEYRAYIMSHDDHILRPVELVYEDDEVAKEQARKLVDGHDEELWSGERFIVRLQADGEK
jgi:hypothetical protein